MLHTLRSEEFLNFLLQMKSQLIVLTDLHQLMIAAHLRDFNLIPAYYDKIVTGDLGSVGKDILIDLMRQPLPVTVQVAASGLWFP